MEKLQKTKFKRPLGDRVVHGLFIAFLALFSIVCLYPFVQVIISSFTDETALAQDGYTLFPGKWSLDAYRTLFNGYSILNAYGLTIAITVCGTLFSMLVMSLAAYALSGTHMKYRNVFNFYFYFTVLFSGGMIPSYILITNYLHLTDNFLVFILPGSVSVWNMFLLRNFFNEIPAALVESAKLEGAGEIRIAFQIVIPLSLPAIASISLFMALAYWNIWMESLLYIKQSGMYTLQYIIVKMLNTANAASNMAGEGFHGDATRMPTETLKLATAIITIGPIILLYPFLQKYFVAGLKVGGVKG